MRLDSDPKHHVPFASRRKVTVSLGISSQYAASTKMNTILRSRLHGSLRPPSGSMVVVKRWRHYAYVILIYVFHDAN
jgi:hypothetical protein